MMLSTSSSLQLSVPAKAWSLNIHLLALQRHLPASTSSHKLLSGAGGYTRLVASIGKQGSRSPVVGQGSAVTGWVAHTPKNWLSLAWIPAWHRACMNFCCFWTPGLGVEICAKSMGTGSTGVCSGQRSLKRDAWPFRKRRWTLRALPSLWAVSQAPWWHLDAVALPSSSRLHAERWLGCQTT